ncbi:MAG TPA: hypothetical protein VFY13_05945 [Luteolibacter sp.]|nr:hypothetical protein [Luteolibacter sp.]
MRATFKPNLSAVAATSTLLACCIPSCAVKREVPLRPAPDVVVPTKAARQDYSQYSKIPNTPTSLAYRTFLKTVPYSRQRAFWGNWGGCGNRGGLPVDEMDEIFRRHDIIYHEARTLHTLRIADKACLQALAKLDTRSMSPQAREFHLRSTRFFSNPNYVPIGKPISSFLRFKESKNCPFRSEEEIYRLFEFEPSAVPYVKNRPADLKPASKENAPAFLARNEGRRS